MPEANDSVSIAAGKSKCGPILYTADFLGLDGIVAFNQKTRQLDFMTKNMNGIYSGVFSFLVKTSLLNYPKIAGLNFPYTFELK